MPAKEHGPDIDWFMFYGDEFVDVQEPTFESDFNKDVVGAEGGRLRAVRHRQGRDGLPRGPGRHVLVTAG